jgi:hypothetical protein
MKRAPASVPPLRTSTSQPDSFSTYPPSRKAQNATISSCAVFAPARFLSSIAHYGTRSRRSGWQTDPLRQKNPGGEAGARIKDRWKDIRGARSRNWDLYDLALPALTAFTIAPGGPPAREFACGAGIHEMKRPRRGTEASLFWRVLRHEPDARTVPLAPLPRDESARRTCSVQIRSAAAWW